MFLERIEERKVKNRRIIKRILAGLLIVSMGASVTPTSVCAEDKFNE